MIIQQSSYKVSSIQCSQYYYMQTSTIIRLCNEIQIYIKFYKTHRQASQISVSGKMQSPSSWIILSKSNGVAFIYRSIRKIGKYKQGRVFGKTSRQSALHRGVNMHIVFRWAPPLYEPLSVCVSVCPCVCLSQKLCVSPINEQIK